MLCTVSFSLLLQKFESFISFPSHRPSRARRCIHLAIDDGGVRDDPSRCLEHLNVPTPSTGTVEKSELMEHNFQSCHSITGLSEVPTGRDSIMV